MAAVGKLDFGLIVFLTCVEGVELYLNLFGLELVLDEESLLVEYLGSGECFEVVKGVDAVHPVLFVDFEHAGDQEHPFRRVVRVKHLDVSLQLF